MKSTASDKLEILSPQGRKIYNILILEYLTFIHINIASGETSNSMIKKPECYELIMFQKVITGQYVLGL